MSTLSASGTTAFTYTAGPGGKGAIQTVTIGASGYYDIAAEGAQGGGGKKGGLGAMASGDVYLVAGAKLEIVVGGQGGASSYDGAGGGGGSFVIETTGSGGAVDVNEVIAGGGGGAGYRGAGLGGQTTGSGGPGQSGGKGGVNGDGGAGGSAGIGGQPPPGLTNGGGGGGFIGGDAANPGAGPGPGIYIAGGKFTGGNGSVGSATIGSGGVGGGGYTSGGGAGGYGGGGGGGNNGGGGGGGYGGGGGGGARGGGGGGAGSYVNPGAVDVTKVAATHGGAGLVTISAVTLPTTISGAGGAVNVASGLTAKPFVGVAVNDPYAAYGASDTLTITLSDPNASLVSGAGYTGPLSLVSDGNGVYTLGGVASGDTASNVTAALDALTLDAPMLVSGASGGETLNLSLSDVSSADPSAPAGGLVEAKIAASQTFAYAGKVQTVTIGASGYYDITAEGAQGGGGKKGGLGAMASGDVYLVAGAKLEIVVGGQGGASSYDGAGGGGGSFVIETTGSGGAVDVNEVIAGGGGGAGYRGAGLGGQTTGSGGPGQSGGKGGVNGDGGAGGSAGIGGQPPPGLTNGGGGGGFIGGDAANPGAGPGPGIYIAGGKFTGGNGSVGSATIGSGGVGGGGYTSGGGAGGYGGGGGGGNNGGGGGGGYGGGGGGGGYGGGGGGAGSYVNPDAVDVTKVAATHGGAGLVTLAFEGTVAPCYVKGARILTERGEVAVEDLVVGDRVATASGGRRPVVWLGHRRVDCVRHPAPRDVQPVRVRAGAFGEAMPHRDLWLSPGHSIACEGALIPVSALVNGRSVVQVEVAEVEYWHVELDAHDVILAEGLPAESYLDTGNRTAFANGGAFVQAHPDFAPKHWADTCLPLVLQGPLVIAAKARLIARLAEQGCCVTPEADAHVVVDGLRVEPIKLSETKLAFVLESGGCEIALRSRTFVPAQTKAASGDSRALGLCVGALQIDGALAALGDDEAFGLGWHDSEYENGTFTHRWTTGATPLPFGARFVVVDLAGAGSYWRQTLGDRVALTA